jgi:hypothetical protein
LNKKIDKAPDAGPKLKKVSQCIQWLNNKS